MAYKEVYRSGHGWVKQFKDGVILGPFSTIDQAQNAQREGDYRGKPIEDIIQERKKPKNNT